MSIAALPIHQAVKLALATDAFQQSLLGPNVTELEVAKAIRDGRLDSPQRFKNIWLFAMRVTGTGMAYRSKLNEYACRPPEEYLNDEFLARCNGLPVILDHPEELILNTEEFSKRVIGSIMLPYIDRDEVWSIARIYDAPAAQMMIGNQLSTSPAVFFTDPDVNTTTETESGAKILDEGKPGLIDHLAVCVLGVWDKGGPPVGIEISDETQRGRGDSVGGTVSTTSMEGGDPTKCNSPTNLIQPTTDAQEPTMAEQDKMATDDKQSRRDDDDAGKKILDSLEKLHGRLDDFDGRLSELEKRGDKARKDDNDNGYEPMGPESKNDDDDDDDDAAKKDAGSEEVAAMPQQKLPTAAAVDEEQTAVKAVEKAHEAEGTAQKAMKAAADTAKRVDSLVSVIGSIPKSTFDTDYPEMAKFQAKADSVYSAFGDSAPGPLRGEDLMAYRKRLATGLKQHSQAWKDVDLAKVDASVLGIAEGQIYADAAKVAAHPTDVPEGVLIERVTQDPTGRRISTFVGQPSAWTSQFKTPRLYQHGINKGN